MKKLFYLFLIAGLVVASCNKAEEIPTEQDVVLKISTAASGFKSGTCDNPVAQYALIEIDGTTKSVDVFYLDGIIYTNTLKLSVGSHSVTMFVLKNDNGTPTNTSDDFEVLATPLEGATFSSFVADALPLTFTTGAFLKNEVDIQVLCFKPTTITDFGFSWFAIDRIIVREFCFFGDICVADYATYANTLYASQSNGLQHDMPAIFKVVVFRNGIQVATYNNESYKGEGSALCAQYPDYIGVDDTFKFELWVKVMNGSTFAYVKYHEWTVLNDANLPNIGTDNVLDFVIGTCVPTADLVLNW